MLKEKFDDFFSSESDDIEDEMGDDAEGESSDSDNEAQYSSFDELVAEQKRNNQTEE